MSFTVPLDELEIRASRAGGPGGQHVNKTSTRVEVRWNVRTSSSVSAAQRERLERALASRLDRHGRIRVATGARRSQMQNRRAAIERLNALVERALHVPKARKKTKPSRAVRERRTREKRRRSERKRQRRPPEDD